MSTSVPLVPILFSEFIFCLTLVTNEHFIFTMKDILLGNLVPRGNEVEKLAIYVCNSKHSGKIFQQGENMTKKCNFAEEI